MTIHAGDYVKGDTTGGTVLRFVCGHPTHGLCGVAHRTDTTARKHARGLGYRVFAVTHGTGRGWQSTYRAAPVMDSGRLADELRDTLTVPAFAPDVHAAAELRRS